MCTNIPLYISNFLTNILLSENKYTNKDMMLEWKKQAGEFGKMQMTLCNMANSILGTLNRNTQQSDEGERKPQKRKQQQQQNWLIRCWRSIIKRKLLLWLGHIK